LTKQKSIAPVHAMASGLVGQTIEPAGQRCHHHASSPDRINRPPAVVWITLPVGRVVFDRLALLDRCVQRGVG
jgi:hypothetical protein